QPAPPIHKVQTTRLKISGVNPSPAKVTPADSADSCAPILSIGADPITPILIIVKGLPIKEIKDTATIIIPIDGPIAVILPVFIALLIYVSAIPTSLS